MAHSTTSSRNVASSFFTSRRFYRCRAINLATGRARHQVSAISAASGWQTGGARRQRDAPGPREAGPPNPEMMAALSDAAVVSFRMVAAIGWLRFARHECASEQKFGSGATVRPPFRGHVHRKLYEITTPFLLPVSHMHGIVILSCRLCARAKRFTDRRLDAECCKIEVQPWARSEERHHQDRGRRKRHEGRRRPGLADGTTRHWESTAAYDGKDAPVTGNNPDADTIARTRINATTVQTIRKRPVKSP